MVDSLGSLEALTAFALEECKRRETDLVELHIDTGGAEPRQCPPQRMPFTVREEVAKQLDKMQADGVIEPSISSVKSSSDGLQKGWHP